MAIIKLFCFLLVCFFVICSGLVGLLSMSESYFFPAPYIDTWMADGYTPAKFDQVRVGDSEAAVIKKLGQPLWIYPERSGPRWDYTGDGKLLEASHDGQSYMDFAWYASSLYLHNGIVIKVDKGWRYD